MAKILIGILCIDRDHMNILRLCNSIKTNIMNNPDYKFEMLILTRRQDKKTIKKFHNNGFKHIIVTNNYKIQARHNLEQISNNRNYIMKYAKDNEFDWTWFIDSDIILYPNTFHEMISIRDYDIICSLYPIKWKDNLSICLVEDRFTQTLMIDKTFNKNIMFKKFADLTDDDNILIAGMGCTLIKSNCFEIGFEVFSVYDMNHVQDQKVPMYQGEDIGFFIKAFQADKKVKVQLDHVVKHDIVD